MIYSRLMKNEKDEMFIPLDVEGDSESHTAVFMSPQKVTLIFIMAVMLIPAFIYIQSLRPAKRILDIVLLVILYIILIKFVIFEELYYKKAYKEVKKNELITSGKLWGIMYVNDLPQGASVGFVDGYTGCFIRLERGSIVGQPDDYTERCDEIYSNFLQECNKLGYFVKIINTMELASKDKRLQELSDKIKDEPNKMIREMLNMNMAYMKTITDYAYYDTETILLYTPNSLKLNTIIDDAIDLSGKLLQGAYLSRKILRESDLVDLHTGMNNVVYIDLLNAKSEVFDSNTNTTRKFKLKSLNFKNGNKFMLDDGQIKKISYLYNIYIHDKSKNIDIINELMTKSVQNNEKDKNTKENNKKLQQNVVQTQKQKRLQDEIDTESESIEKDTKQENKTKIDENDMFDLES